MTQHFHPVEKPVGVITEDVVVNIGIERTNKRVSCVVPNGNNLIQFECCVIIIGTSTKFRVITQITYIVTVIGM